jgi:ATP-binding cassette subfamily B protein
MLSDTRRNCDLGGDRADLAGEGDHMTTPPSTRRGLPDLLWLVRTVARVAPLPFAVWTVITMLGGALEAGELWSMRGSVNALVESARLRAALPWLIGLAGVFACAQMVQAVTPYLRELIRISAGRHLQFRTLTHLSMLPLERLDAAEPYDLIQRVMGGADERGPDLIGEGFGVVQLVPGVLANAGALLLVAWWLPAVVGVATALLMWQGAKLGGKLRELEVSQTRAKRLADYYASLLTTRPHAAEVRLWRLGSHLLALWDASVTAYIRARLRLGVHNSLQSLASDLGMPAVFAVSLATLGLVHGPVAAGNAALVLSAVRSLTIGLFVFRSSVQGFAGHAGYAADVRVLLSLPTEMQEAEAHRRVSVRGRVDTGAQVWTPFPETLRAGIAISNVSYQYPGADAWALREVSLTILPAELVALVGPNGAGKTTLAQIILGLRRPSTGDVTYDGIPHASISPQDLRRHCAAVFQRPVRYPTTVSQNISLSSHGRIADALELFGTGATLCADAREDAVPSTGDPMLGPEFGGIDLSGGQWQQLAIARARWRSDSALLVLDEPTASLDPLAEVRVFQDFLKVARGRTVVMVSHRLGPARLADRVVVLHEGRIVEQGAPTELLRGDGQFAQMFRSQARWYQ